MRVNLGVMSRSKIQKREENTVRTRDLERRNDKLAVEKQELQANVNKLTVKNKTLSSGNEDLQSRVDDLEALTHTAFSTSLNAQLTYLSHLSLRVGTSEPLIEDAQDAEFARSVLDDNIPNRFHTYYNHVNNGKLTESELKTIETFDYNAERAALDQKYGDIQQVRNDLASLEKMRVQSEELKKDLEPIVTERRTRIDSYAVERKDLDAKQKTHDELSPYAARYKKIEDHIETLKQTSEKLPVVFDLEQAGQLEVYLPVRAEASDYLRQQLQQELSACFGGAPVKLHPHDLLAYTIDGENKVLYDGIDKMVDDVPLVLRLAGITEVFPVRLG